MPEHPADSDRLPRRSHTRHRGFTLLEASLTTVIVGTGVLAMIEAQQAYHRKNEVAMRAGTGQLLANEIRELMHGMPQHGQVKGGREPLNLGPEVGETSPAEFNDLDDFLASGTGFNPPIDAMGQPIPGEEMLRWRQVISLGGVFESLLDASATEQLGTTNMVRVSVTAQFDADPDPTRQRWVPVAELVWIVPPSR